MSEAPFVHRLRVRYNECDQQDIVFNANYFTYFDIGITELWREAVGGWNLMLDEHQVDCVVGEANAKFRAPAHFDDWIDIEMTIVRLGTTSIQTRAQVMRDGELLVDGLLRHVFVGLESRVKTPIPDAVREGLARFASETAEAAPAATERAG